ncbi:MAG: hypothetical protein N3E47_03270 [Candidatus Bathyarchaeota archaeon]|nr:hypothetical protein [Candidatus Bathyarchaeota archaeon]
MRRRGLRQSEIAREIGALRQEVNRAVLAIDSKVERTLIEIAHMNKLNILHVDPVNGILEAYSPSYKIPVVISFSEANGVQTWYLYEGRCGECERANRCREMLIAEAREREVDLTEEDLKAAPTHLAKKIFARYLRIGGNYLGQEKSC